MWIADPKALNHILQKSGYFYAKPSSTQELAVLLTGPNGIGSADGELSIAISPFLSNNIIGDVHKRRRRVIAPAFGLVEARGFLPYAMGAVIKVNELFAPLETLG